MSDINVVIETNKIQATITENIIVAEFPWTQWVPGVWANELSEEPTGSINWINTYYTLLFTPATNTEKVHLNWLRLKRTVDYTISSNVISIIIPPISWDIIIVDYNI